MKIRSLKRLILKADMKKKGYKHINKVIKDFWKERKDVNG